MAAPAPQNLVFHNPNNLFKLKLPNTSVESFAIVARPMASAMAFPLIRGALGRVLCARSLSTAAARPAASDPVAFLGLGAMGHPMAANLGNGDRKGGVFVWNRTRSVAEEHAEKHGSRILEDDLAGLATTRAVFLCMPTSKEVEDTMRIAAPYLRPGTIVVDCTSGHPQQTQAIAAWLKKDCDVDFVDCAVSGGPFGARKGTLAAFVGCDDAEVMKSIVPDLETFAGHIVHLGPAGAGHAVKAINNAMNVSNLLCATEGAFGGPNPAARPARSSPLGLRAAPARSTSLEASA